LGVESDLHSTANFALDFPHDASTSASRRPFFPVSGFSRTRRKERGGSETTPFRSCSSISFSVGIFLILPVFLSKKIPYFRKTSNPDFRKDIDLQVSFSSRSSTSSFSRSSASRISDADWMVGDLA
jgi:hypothetical protein